MLLFLHHTNLLPPRCCNHTNNNNARCPYLLKQFHHWHKNAAAATFQPVPRKSDFCSSSSFWNSQRRFLLHGIPAAAPTAEKMQIANVNAGAAAIKRWQSTAAAAATNTEAEPALPPSSPQPPPNFLSTLSTATKTTKSAQKTRRTIIPAATTMSDHIKVKFDLESGTFHQQEENDDDEEQYEPLTAIDANIPSMSTYRELYRQSINNSDQFWRTVAKQLHFDRFSDRGLEWNLDSRKGEVFVRFMAGAHTNLAYNCLERNLRKGLGKRVAYRWEGNEPGDEQSITYEQLHKQVVNFSAVLRARGVRKGDVVAIYLPMILELPIAMLACARIGAVHSVVFAGFSADSLASRICHARARVLITADGYYRGNKLIKLKALADHAADICAMHSEPLDHIIVVDHLQRVRVPDGDGKKSVVDENGGTDENGTNKENTNVSSDISSENITTEDEDDIQSEKRRDLSWSEEMAKCREEPSPVEWMESEEPLFILYTSGSTGTPKGILHTTSGYMCHVYLSTKCAFDAQPERDVYWATADCGWITGHSYVVYGPLLNGLTSVIFEGVPSYPDHSRMWAIVEKYGVTKLYTAPTAIRALMAYPERMVTKHDRSTLRVIGTVGEPINPGAWKWLYDVVGERRCAIVDTYWQTETGGHVITPMPYATPTKPGSATLPFFGVVPVLLDHEGRYIEGPGEGNLCFGRPWPGMMRSMWGDHDRFVQTYFSSFKGYYFTGDGARRDDDGYYWITGRVDDLMNVSGHLLSTAEIESALALHPDVVEAAVVSAPHPVKGHFPYAFVTLSNGKKLDDGMVHELKQIVRHKIGAIAIPDVIHEAPGLPKTRSGKVTRRILRKIAEGDKHADLGDTSTLIDETVIARLWENREMLHQATRRTTG